MKTATTIITRPLQNTITAILLVLASFNAKAAVISQVFTNEWRVDVWDYYGDVAAMRWAYTPYVPFDANMGTLQKVEVSIFIKAETDVVEPFSFGTSFFTGWAPDDFQFGYEETLTPDKNRLVFHRSWTFQGTEVTPWTSYQYFPPAHTYFISRTVSSGHWVSAKTVLKFHYRPA